jgi:hypothetical protein
VGGNEELIVTVYEGGSQSKRGILVWEMFFLKKEEKYKIFTRRCIIQQKVFIFTKYYIVPK